MDIKETCQALKRLRLQCNLTQHELALHSGVAYGTLRRLEASGQGSLADYLCLHNSLQARLVEQEAAGLSAAQDLSTRQRVRKARLPQRIPTQAFVEQPAHSAQISHKLGLDFPYDWSNPAMPEDTLIAKVLDKARFPDVSRIFARFGHARVKQVASDFGIDLSSGVLGSLMPGLELGLSRYVSH